MAVEDIQLKIEGLAQFSKDLKKLDAELPKQQRVALNEAAEVVVQRARPKVPRGRTGKARKSVKAKSTRTKVRVSGGGNRAPYYPWLDFGDKSGIGRNFSVHRPFRKEGRYIYRTYYDRLAAGEFQEVLQRALLDVAKQAGVEIE